MTVKDFKRQIAPYSTSELHLFELAIYQELEGRGELPAFKEEPKVVSMLKAIDEGIDDGTVNTITLDTFKGMMNKYNKNSKLTSH